MARGTYKTAKGKEAQKVLVEKYGKFFNGLLKGAEVRIPTKAKKVAGIGIWLDGVRLMKIRSRTVIVRNEFAPSIEGTPLKKTKDGKRTIYSHIKSVNWDKMKEIAANLPTRTSGPSKVKLLTEALLPVAK